MKFLSFLAAAVAVPLASAIQLTSPVTNSTITKGSDMQVTWTSVDTDPSLFSIYLVNFVTWPPFYTQLASDVDTSLGAYSVHVPCDVSASYGFQVNAINGTNVYVIYAQTATFRIQDASGSCVDPVTTTSACAATATATKTVYVTQTATP